jgi:chemotaxis protein methyltransferase CheR
VPPAQDLGFDFSNADFERVRQLIYQHAGIALNDSKRPMVYSRLARRLRALHLQRFSDYLALLNDPQSTEWESFTNALTTNLTAFFREAHHFDILQQFLQPRVARGESLSLWSAAASTGEEPYSIAMTLAEAFGQRRIQARLLATDLDTQVLAHASAGVYAEDKVAQIPDNLLKRYFLKGSGQNAGRVKVRPVLQDIMTFKQLNLLSATWPMKQPFDAIFCRNVMIYFDKTTQRTLLEKMAGLLKPDGLLFIGHSENLHHVTDLFQACGKTVYRLTQKTSRPYGQ